MKLIICTTCDSRVNRCTCGHYTSRNWQEVELETPAEVEARLHRLLDAVVKQAPSAEAACRRLKSEAMQASALPDGGRRTELRPKIRALRGEKLA